MSTAPKETEQQAVKASAAKIHPVREDYMIHPLDDTNREEINQTHDAIRRMLGPDIALEQRWVNTAGEGGMPPWMVHWLVPLTEEQVTEIEKLEGVEDVKKDYWEPNDNIVSARIR